ILLCLASSWKASAAVPTSSANPTNCSELKQELAAMHEAQEQIMNSLVGNHEKFASSLEEYSDLVTTSQGSSKATKSLSKNMDQSAKAFRHRGVQAKQMAEKLDKATEDLLVRVSSCLK
ncbi:MAG TPA: hypothetical protein VN132_05780, partial [Bdellovibrio sp.]|nr:hypothetical protein [Bdellovibrio sp.]